MPIPFNKCFLAPNLSRDCMNNIILLKYHYKSNFTSIYSPIAVITHKTLM